MIEARQHPADRPLDSPQTVSIYSLNPAKSTAVNTLDLRGRGFELPRLPNQSLYDIPMYPQVKLNGS